MTQTTINQPTSDTTTRLALTYLVREPRVKPTRKKAIVLLHGVGSNEQDLFSLANSLPDEFLIISARGQFTLGAGRYAWYNVDFSTGKPVFNAAQEASSREVIRTFIRQVKETYQIEEVYLGGFSQGAIMSYSIGLIHPDEVQGVIALSGRVLNEIRPIVKNDAYLKKLIVFVAHGIQDGTLSIQYARQAKDYLESLGVQLTYREYPIGHQINTEVLQDLKSWLTN